MIALRRGAFVALLLLALVPSTARAQTPALTLDALRNGTYPVRTFLLIPSTVTLVDGGFKMPLLPGSASLATVNFDRAVVGTIAGAPAAAVVLYAQGGGSGTDYWIFAVGADGKALVGTSIGDRTPVKTVSIDGAGQIALDMLVHGPGEGFCCATQPEHCVYAVPGNVLTLLAKTPLPAATGNADLANAQHTSMAFEVVLLAMLLGAIGVTRALGRTRRQ